MTSTTTKAMFPNLGEGMGFDFDLWVLRRLPKLGASDECIVGGTGISRACRPRTATGLPVNGVGLPF